MRWIGLDAHQLFIQLTEITDGNKVRHGRFATTPEGIEALIRDFLGSDASVVLEASTGVFSLCEVLRPHAGSVVVAHPSQTRGASALHVKTDKRDSELLARLLMSGFIRPVWVPPLELRTLRGTLQYRKVIIGYRIGMINRLKAVLRDNRIEYPTGLKFTKRVRWGKTLSVIKWPDEKQAVMVNSVIRMLDWIDGEIKALDGLVGNWVDTNPDGVRLQTIPGVGPLIAAALLAEIGDIRRFDSPSKLCAYAGLVPKVHSSGKSVRIGRLIKGCANSARSAIWMAVLNLVRYDSRFQATYAKLAERRCKKISIVACSRKLLVVVWHMLRSGEDFRHHPVG
jgi:transposase